MIHFPGKPVFDRLIVSVSNNLIYQGDDVERPDGAIGD